MALSRDVVIRLLGDATSAVAAQKAAADAAEVSVTQYRKAEREFDKQAKAMEAASRKQRAAMQEVGTAALGFGAAVSAGLGLSIKAAIDWESAWAGVTKTVSGTPQQLKGIEDGLRGLARELPATHGEIAAVAEAAGQLGVKTDSIIEFTRTMIDLGETTNLSADEAATAIAQMMNVMRTAPEDVGRLGATLVALGNAGASTEADIMDMTQRLAGAAELIGASESDVMALASSMADMGIQAELGGGAMSRVMLTIYEAMQEGGDAAQGFADVAGMSAQDFAAKWQSSPVEAVDLLVQGLGRVKGEGGNVVQTLSDLGISGTQNLQVMLSLAGAGDQLTDALRTANEGWTENSALVEEAAKRYETTESKLQMARNGLNDAAIEIGGTFLPVLADLAGGLADVTAWFADLPGPVKDVLAGLAGVAGVGGLAAGAFLLLFPRVMDTVSAFKTLNTTHPTAAAGMGKVAKAAGAAAVAFTALQLITSAFSESSDELSRFASKTQALGGPAVEGQIKSLSEEIERQKAIVDEAAISWEILGVGIFSSDEAKDAQNRVDALNERLAALQHQKELDAIASEGAASATRVMSGEVAGLTPSIESTYSSLASYAAALGMGEEAAQDLIDKSGELGTTLADFINPLGVYTGMLDEKKAAEEEAARKAAEEAGKGAEAWEDFVVDTGFSFDEYMRRLQEQVDAQTNWQTNMLLLAGRVSEGTLAELARMGPEGAPLVADLVTRSDAELDVMDDLFGRRSKEATDAWGAQLTMAQPVLAEIARKGGQGAADAAAVALASGTATLGKIAADWGIAIAGGVNPILEGLGKPKINPNQTQTNWKTNSVLPPTFPNADGNLYEQHQAEIAPAGAWRVWAEPETGGEAYIPLSPAKRARSLSIWQETGRRLNAFANGGFASVDSIPRPPSTAPFGAPFSTAADGAMEKVYNEARGWLAAHLEPASGGSASGLLPIMAAARQYVMDTYGIRNIGGYANRNIAGTNVKSDHAMGKAIDIMTTNGPLGWAIANDFAFGPAHSQFRAENVIWQQSISSNGGRFKGMADRGSPTQNHRDHVHVDTYDSGGWLRPGYTLAYNGTGRPERVLTAEQARGVPVGAGIAVGSATSGDRVAAGPTNVTVNARVFVGDREITDIVRVEAEAVAASGFVGMGQAARIGMRS